MKTRNIISVLHGEEVIESSGLRVDKKAKILKEKRNSDYEVIL